jgi:hypothetical protein
MATRRLGVVAQGTQHVAVRLGLFFYHVVYYNLVVHCGADNIFHSFE